MNTTIRGVGWTDEGITSSTVIAGKYGVTARGPSDADDGARIDAKTLPVEVRVLWETMLRLDPNWSLDDWLAKQAKDELKLVEGNLGREQMRLEQRLNRVNTLAGKLKRMGVDLDEVRWNDPNQRNLFDVFSGEAPKPTEEATEVEVGEPDEGDAHPAAILLDYLPGEPGDDPLLAIVAQFILVEMEEASAAGNLPLSYDEIDVLLEPRGINPDELSEAIEWLLGRGELVEIAEDLFSLNG
ncbi:MAG: hypothetical protein CXX83_02210 [Methanobacteriota archaeon]|nr:MAG: hypothetical protein CXX83_02210 [Euryarchaeota archaeon]